MRSQASIDHRIVLAVGGLLPVLFVGANARAQEEPVTAEGDNVIINCPEQIDLRIIVDYVGKALDLRFVYGEELANQRVELRPSPVELPRKHLLSLLASLLRVRDLAMVEESPGFYRIVRTEQTTRSVPSVMPESWIPQPDSARLVTQVLAVESGDVNAVCDKLKSFMSSPKAGLVPVPERGLIIVTDYESRVALLRELLSLLDSGAPEVEVRRIGVDVADPATLAAQVSTILGESQRLRKVTGMPPAVRGDVMPGAVIVIGSQEQIAEAEALIERLTPDRAELSTRAFTLRYVSVERARQLIDNVVLAPGSGLEAPASTYPDPQGGRLFVTADGPTLAAIAALLEEEDTPLPETRRPLRIYRPRNRTAGELLGTLSELLGEGAEILTLTETATEPQRPFGPPGPNRPPSGAGVVQVPPVPPAREPRADAKTAGRTLTRIQGPDYVLAEDEHTNAILAIGTAEFHAQLQSLIEELDRRRPQVLIEMTLVAITLSDSMELGIELEKLDLGDAWDYLVFTNFGLSSIDAVTGQRLLTPGMGAMASPR